MSVPMMKGFWIFIWIFMIPLYSVAQEDIRGVGKINSKEITEGKNTGSTKAKEDSQKDHYTGFGPVKRLVLDREINLEMAAAGHEIYKNSCTTCHKTHKDFIGPKLKGVADKRSPEWVMNKILAPLLMQEKDTISQELRKKYGSFMPNIDITRQEARLVLEYLRTL